MSAGARRVLLVDPPLRYYTHTVLGVATIQPVLERAGFPTDSLCGTLCFPRSSDTGPMRTVLRTHFSQFCFAPHLFPSLTAADCVRAIRDSLLEQFSLQGSWIARDEMTMAHIRFDDGALERAIHEDIELSGICLERCVEAAADPVHDIVGFSCTFETQIPAALAIASRLKARRPDVIILFGGSACFGDPADELLRAFPCIDAVCHCEGDAVAVPLVSAFRAPPEQRLALLSEVPGIVWRDATGAVRRNPAPPLLYDLDTLPTPNYDDFMAQLRAGEYADVTPLLHFESSRGCWYGEKRLCSFCGLNAEGIAFRKKSADRVVSEIQELYARYPQAERLCATDNILGLDYLHSVMPRLTEWRRTLKRPLKLFFELKANLRRDQLRVLAEAGVDLVQPGIESLNDGVLKLMAKGCTGLGQVQTLKWMEEQSIRAAYHILVLNPLETPEQYREMTALVPFIEHLRPPLIASTELQRFSPYFTDPAHYGLRNLRARPYYSWAYPVPGIDLDRLAYRFDYDHDMFADGELIEARRAFINRAMAWTESWKANQLYYVDHGDSLVIHDQRTTFARRHRLSGLGLRVFRYCDQVRSGAQIDAQFAAVEPEALHALLDAWLRRRWICRDGRGRYLVVVPEQARKAESLGRGSQHAQHAHHEAALAPQAALA